MSTKSHSFFLKHPKSDKETLILFTCYFKYEEKKFVYSTGEKITPANWDFENKQPIKSGKFKSTSANSIQIQLDRYSKIFKEVEERCKVFNEDFTSKLLKEEFEKEFKKTPSGQGLFFKAFDEFVDFKTKRLDWGKSTQKRYKNIKNILQKFEKSKKYKLTFNSINSKFDSEFTDYCVKELKHSHNTFARNIGLFKTFMYWAVSKKYTYKKDFTELKINERVATKQIALKKEDLEVLLNHKFGTDKHEKVRDVFVFACLTGMRFGELKFITKENIINNSLHLKEEKDKKKDERTIPLNEIALYLLRKYDYKLPIIANQKQNKYIKEVFHDCGYTQMTEKITTIGKEDIRTNIPFYDRVSTHTARRTFITLMKKEKYSDKLIASISGHKDMKTLNKYYQVDDDDKKTAVDEVFKMDFKLLKKA